MTMFFIDWWQLGLFSVMLAVIFLSALAMYWTRRRSKWIFVPTLVFGVPLGGIAGLVVLLIMATETSGCDSHSQPVYSPDHTVAARVETYDGGALGGGSNVRLYLDHGFVTKTVFYGNWQSVGVGDLIWNGNRELTLRYEPSEGYHEDTTCSSFLGIRVRCVAR